MSDDAKFCEEKNSGQDKEIMNDGVEDLQIYTGQLEKTNQCR